MECNALVSTGFNYIRSVGYGVHLF